MNFRRAFSPSLWSVAWRLRAGLLAVPALLIALAAFQYWMSYRVADAYQEVTDRIGWVSIHLEVMMSSAEQMEAAARGYVITRGDESYREKYEEAATAMEAAYEKALPLTVTKPELRKKLQALHQMQEEWQRDLTQPAFKRVEEGNDTPAWASAWARNNVIRFDEVQAQHRMVREDALRIRRERIAAATRLRGLVNAASVVVLAFALLLASRLTTGLIRIVQTPLQRMVEHSHRVQSGDYSPLQVVRQDEFGRVTSAMNAMSSAIEARLERERLLGRIHAAISRSLDWDTVLQTTVDEAGRALGASRCFICLYQVAEANNGESTPLVAYEWTAADVRPMGVGQPLPLPTALATLQRQRTLVCHDVENSGELGEITAEQRQALADAGVCALLDTSLRLRGEQIGILGIHQCDAPRQWQEEDEELIETVAAQVATALDNARLFRESVERQAELQGARDALAESSEQLQEKNRELEEFVYTISHDLKAPLISMQGYLAALQADYGDELEEDAQFYIQRASANATQLQSLISDLIELSRIGRVQETRQSVDLNELLREVGNELELQAGAKGVHLHVAPDLPTICCERKRIRQVFVNLIDNAIKYSDPQKTERTIKVNVEETAAEWIIRVRDNGIGIAPEHLEKAFGIFQRVGISGEPGTGIGLSIVRRTADNHQGRTWAESEGPGQGTTFYFSLAKSDVVGNTVSPSHSNGNSEENHG